MTPCNESKSTQVCSNLKNDSSTQSPNTWYSQGRLVGGVLFLKCYMHNLHTFSNSVAVPPTVSPHINELTVSPHINELTVGTHCHCQCMFSAHMLQIYCKSVVRLKGSLQEEAIQGVHYGTRSLALGSSTLLHL